MSNLLDYGYFCYCSMQKTICLTNNSLRVEIALLGAELISFSAGKEELLWKVNPRFWNRVAPNLFPIVGRLMHDELVWDGVKYPMNQHGFARNTEFQLLEKDSDFALFEISNTEETAQQYPFPFRFRILYELLEDRLKVSYVTYNPGDSILPYSVGGHPAFALAGPLDEHELWFDLQVNSQRWLIENGYYNGKTVKINCGKALELNNDYFAQDAIVLRSPEFSTATLVHKTKGKLATVDCSSWDAVGFWTKPGAPFLCIEPWWGWADSVHNYGDFSTKEALHWLEVDEEEKLFYEIIVPQERLRNAE